MKRHIGFLLCVLILTLSGNGPSTAQPGMGTESGEDSGLPLETLPDNAPLNTLPTSESRNIDLVQSNSFVIPESTKGFDEQKVLQDPLCDPTNRPMIQTISPDEARPGDTLRVTGEHFGAKTRCLYSVTFGEYPGENLTLLEDNVFEVRIPKELRAGVVFLNVVTNGGSARSLILIKG